MHREFIKCIFGIDKLAITPIMMINWVATIFLLSLLLLQNLISIRFADHLFCLIVKYLGVIHTYMHNIIK